MLSCRLIIDPPSDGAWNMAVDEVLLDQAADDGLAALRFYQWSPATLSLGYFQPYQEHEQRAESAGCPVVRRHSGGGAIVHDRELTYSLALPASAANLRDPFALYLSVHQSLVECLESLLGPSASGRFRLCAEAIPPAGGVEPFLCFLRRARGDLLLEPEAPASANTVDGAHKVAGSAQRKRRGAVLQHGSILLAKSPCAPELAGINDVLASDIQAQTLADSWAAPLAERLGLEILDLREGELPGSGRPAARLLDEAAVAEALSRFTQPAWTRRR